MARKPRRFNLRRVRVSPEEPLLTAVTKVVLTQGVSGASTAQYRAMSLKGTWSISGLDAADGPITVGWAHSDYTITEIKECIEAVASISPGDKIAQEKANRLVRVVGTFVEGGDDNLNNGKPVSTRLNWLITIGQQVNLFAYNDGDTTLTTGAIVNFLGDLWVKDA